MREYSAYTVASIKQLMVEDGEIYGQLLACMEVRYEIQKEQQDETDMSTGKAKLSDAMGDPEKQAKAAHGRAQQSQSNLAAGQAALRAKGVL